MTLHPAPGGRDAGSLHFERADVAEVESLVDDVSFSAAELAQASSSEHRLLYRTAELAEPLHLSGTPRLTMTMSADEPAANLSVLLAALPWEEAEARQPNFSVITRGWADPQNHRSLEESDPLVPGEMRTFAFDLQPTDQVIPAGKRIALVIFSSDREHTLWPEPGTELSVELAGTGIELPVVGGEAALRGALER